MIGLYSFNLIAYRQGTDHIACHWSRLSYIKNEVEFVSCKLKKLIFHINNPLQKKNDIFHLTMIMIVHKKTPQVTLLSKMGVIVGEIVLEA
uniref:Uncharacterized protein n=1 Tax=Octopus bimaculoides TaxID=37653 RepID=A0A0L8G7W1_OCTBM